MIKMKKIIVLFILAFSLFFSVKTDAISIGEISNNLSAKSIEENENFNAIKGIDDKDKLLASSFYINTLLLESQVNNNTITITDFIVSGNNSYPIQAIMLFSNNKLTNYKVTFHDDVFYEFNIVNDEVEFITLNEIDLCDAFGEYKEDFTLEKNKEVYFSNSISDQSLKTSIINIGFSSIYSILYKQNEKYLEQNVCIFTGTASPFLLEEITALIRIKDQTDGLISDYVIDCNTYILDDDDKILPGHYKFRIITKDNYGNTVFQWVNVMVVDNCGPYLSIPNFTVKYYELLSEEDLISYASVVEESEVVEIYVDGGGYFENAQTTPGIYEAYLYAKDSWDNTSKYKFKINVIDDLPPVIIKQNDYFVTYPYNKLTEDEIKGLITAIDDLDGNIDNNNITVEDLDDYNNNFNKYGSYRMKITVKDSHDNSIDVTVSIHVVDNDYPQIDLSGYEIVLSGNLKLTKEQLKDYLFDSNVNFGIIKLESEYFETENPSGVYNLYIFCEDGTIIESKLSITEEAPLEPINLQTKKSINYAPIIVGIASLGLITGITILGVLVYKKRH